MKLFPILCLLAAAGRALAGDMAFVQDGIEIDAGRIGRLTLEYPKLTDRSQRVVRPLVSRNPAAGRCELNYEGGARIVLTLGADGRIRGEWGGIPREADTLEFALVLPIALNQGGRWKIGDSAGEFPVSKPARPHLYQGHAPALEITGYDGAAVLIGAPAHAFLQLSDNREWNWPVFHWKAFVPLDPAQRAFELTVSRREGSTASAPLVDELGQSARGDWPGKVKSVDQLKADAADEKAYDESLRPPPRDGYGGLAGSGASLGLKATGFFHLEQHEKRWLLVDPEGNAFFHLGVCGFNPNDDYTLVKGRESAYAWIPPREGEFASAFRKDSGGTIVSFHLANQIRKFGAPFDDETYAARMIGRLRGWGFNSVGAFTELGFGAQARRAAQFPGVAHLPLNAWEGIPRIPGIHETFDPFDERTRAAVAENLARIVPAHAQDPRIIGWFIVNEPIYEAIPRVVPSLKGSEHACKRRLVAWLEAKYRDIAACNAAWGTKAGSFAALVDEPLAVSTEAATQDAEAFAGFFLDAYLRLVKENLRRHDPNHLLIGCRLQPGTIDHEWICRALGPHLDVMSFNYYTHGVDLALLRRIHEWTGGRPMMLSEFFWSSPSDSGLAGGREVSSQEERGLAYRNYVEQAAATGFVVGIEWFTLVDQSVTGRWFSGFDGERANTGLLSVVDRPWKPMLSGMMAANYGIYEIWLGKKPPFEWNDPRFRVKP